MAKCDRNETVIELLMVTQTNCHILFSTVSTTLLSQWQSNRVLKEAGTAVFELKPVFFPKSNE